MQIDLTDGDVEALRRASTTSGASVFHRIRSAIDQTSVDGNDRPSRAAALRMVNDRFGAWNGRTETGEQDVERMRSGRLARLHRRRELRSEG